jgi:hypothetical protein
MQPRLEILRVWRSEPGYISVRAALDGRLAIPFEIPEQTYYEDLIDVGTFESFVERQCRSLLDAYGDEREQRSEPVADFVV